MSTRFLLNGREAHAKTGSSILEGAGVNGVEIPHLCSYKDHINGVCRLCLVEAGSPQRIVPACSTKLTEGMQINTDTEQLNDYRRNLLTMLMKEHPAHTEDGEEKCSVHRYAEVYSVPREKASPELQVTTDDSHPGINYSPDLCIMCRKCLVACDDEQVNEVIGISGRGWKSRISFDLDVPMGESSCVSCGACVDACPTGALIEKNWVPAERSVVTICPYCAVGCSIEYGITGNRIVWARGYENGSVNNGKLCVKGKFGFEFEMSRDRLKKPLIRKKIGERSALNGRKINDVFREVSWDEALNLVAGEISSIRNTSGSTSIGGIACDRATNEDVYAFQKLMRTAIGTDNVDQSATLCHAPSAAMLSYATGTGAATSSVDDIKNAKTILLVGSNVDRAHPVISAEIKKAVKAGASLIVVDPRRVELSRHAELNLHLKPGTDVVLFSAIARFILDNKLADEKFIAERTENFEEFSESLLPFSLEYASRITGIPENNISKAAVMYATGKPSLIIWTLGITEHENGSDNVSSLVNLAMLTGNVGKPGTGLSPIRGQNNVQGGADMGAVAGTLPGYQPIMDSEIRKKFSSRWGTGLPDFTGWKSTEMVEAAGKGMLKFLYISGENSVRSHPDSTGVIDAFGKLDFLVVQDIFMTETAEFADVVLPAASSFEKSGTFTNTERRVQLIRPIFDPPGEARADWMIYSELADRLNYDLGFTSSAGIMDEIASLVPAYAGINHARLHKSGLQWPVKDADSEGTRILHSEAFMRGKGRFRVVGWRERDAYAQSNYPYTLITGRQREHYHTATMTSRSEVIRNLETGSLLEMNPDDMAKEHVSDCEMIELCSKDGKVKGMAKSNPDLPSGVIFTTFHYKDLPANVLTPSTLDPPTKTPAYKDTRVRVAKNSD